MTTLSKEDVVRMAEECVFDIEPADEYHAENEVIDSGNRWITDKMMVFAALARADLVAENERLKARLEVADHGWDGISCRDETIKLQDSSIKELRTALAEATNLLIKLVNSSKISRCYFETDWNAAEAYINTAKLQE